MAQVSDAEAQRIIAHMNKDHEESLGHYLEHFGALPSSLAYASPEITSFTTPSMSITYGPAHARREWKYEFKPPMYAGEARKRLEAMHQEARKGLGISEVQINSLVLTPGGIISALVCTSVVLLFLLPKPETIASAFSLQAQYISHLLRCLGVRNPLDPRKTGRIISLVWSGVLVLAHVAEVHFCLKPLFRTYNVRKQSVRVAYMILTVLGGFPVWQGLRDRGQEDEAKLAKSH
ncbi:hypothetical protein JCM10908_005260 [Rhodotorula pacifica]|uniref:DUF2470 domain-containing protein n=1 Tax=Rhodotorula pacifica TaxID=1495444 RepID=UPI0031719405